MSAYEKAKKRKELKDKCVEQEIKESESSALAYQEEICRMREFARKAMQEFHGKNGMVFSENDLGVMTLGRKGYASDLVACKVDRHWVTGSFYNEDAPGRVVLVYFMTPKHGPEHIISEDARFEENLVNWLTDEL